MNISPSARALAQAVLAGDEMAVAGLVDIVHQEMGREVRGLLDLWDSTASRVLAARSAEPNPEFEGYISQATEQNMHVSEYLAESAYEWADALVKVRREFLIKQASGASP